MSERIKALWNYIQDLAQIKGGLYVDAFALVILARLLGPMFGLPGMTASESGIWAATIGAFAYSNNKPGGQA